MRLAFNPANRFLALKLGESNDNLWGSLGAGTRIKHGGGSVVAAARDPSRQVVGERASFLP
jgi:hypothetical protein